MLIFSKVFTFCPPFLISLHLRESKVFIMKLSGPAYRQALNLTWYRAGRHPGRTGHVPVNKHIGSWVDVDQELLKKA
jgi:hypothetical protein